MSVKKIAKEQPDSFEFSSKNIEAAKKIISNYPKGKQQSAVMALLYIAQRQNDNWIPLSAMKYIAKMLEMPYIKVYEVATFYTMYNLAPVGDYFFCSFQAFVIKLKTFWLIFRNFFQTHLSTSPKTISMEPRTAGTSANI